MRNCFLWPRRKWNCAPNLCASRRRLLTPTVMLRSSARSMLGAATFRRLSVALSAVLPSTPLPYRGVRVDVTTADVPTFASRIGPSIASWQADGRQSAMLRLPIEASALAGVAAEHGFEFHHAEGRFCVLKRWLPEEKEDKVPPYATHQVGIAGFVLNAQQELLVVKEWQDTPGGGRVGSPNWKLPGGLIDRGESFEQGAEREVFEETGVKARFCSLLCFWHRHGLTWGKSDLYFVARMEAGADGIEEKIRMQEDEISACRWMAIDEFVQTQDHPLILAVCSRVYGVPKNAEATTPTPSPSSLLEHAPVAELVQHGVQWPGRPPYPTYFAQRGEGRA